MHINFAHDRRWNQAALAAARRRACSSGSATGLAASRAWRIGVLGPVEDLVAQAGLDDLAALHDRHPVGDARAPPAGRGR